MQYVNNFVLFSRTYSFALCKNFGLNRASDVLFILGAQKYNQNRLAILLNFSDPTSLSGFFGHDFGFKLVFGFGLVFSGSGLN